MTNSNLLSVEAGTSVVKKVNKLPEYGTEETIFADIPGSDWNFVESDDNSECVFPFSSRPLQSFQLQTDFNFLTAWC